MKKLCLLIALSLTLGLLAGCGGAEDETVSTGANVSTEGKSTAAVTTAAVTKPAETTAAETVPGNESTVPESEAPAELKVPEMDYWELYNPNGFNTFTAVIVNTNDVAVDVFYDLVFTKDGVETARLEYFSTMSILPGKRDIIWANFDVPAASEADDVKMENVTVTETAYPPIDGKYEYTGAQNGYAYFDFEFESDPELANITFLLYNDLNGNKKPDQGETVVTSAASLTEQKGTASFETAVYSYTDYEVFFTAT